MSNLHAMTVKLMEASSAQTRELALLYPVGRLITFKISSSQVRPSTGRVVGYSASIFGGDVRVECEKVQQRRGRFRDVMARNILGVVSNDELAG